MQCIRNKLLFYCYWKLSEKESSKDETGNLLDNSHRPFLISNLKKNCNNHTYKKRHYYYHYITKQAIILYTQQK